ncbi:MAG: hypothetical protein WBQ23_12545 [Bacteroidota bacterium]
MKRLLLVVGVAICCLPLGAINAQSLLHWVSGSSQTHAISGKQSGTPLTWNPISDASPLGNGSYRVGRWDSGGDSYDDILCFQWELPADRGLVAGAVIDTARLRLRYGTDSLIINITILAPNYDVSSTNRSTIYYDAVYQRVDVVYEQTCTGPNPLCGHSKTLDGYEGDYELWTAKTQWGTLYLTDAVQDAIDNHNALFSILITAKSISLPGQLWYIKPSDVTLELYYHPPNPTTIDDIKITNVVDGTVDYDLEPESRVRGDQNVYQSSPNAYFADYSQLPHFEPPYATRSWDTWRYHIAETWFAKFEDPSLPRRQKFLDWNNISDDYKAIFLTDVYNGTQKEFQANSASAYPARHKMKREITHEYDGLPIEFKDP